MKSHDGEPRRYSKLFQDRFGTFPMRLDQAGSVTVIEASQPAGDLSRGATDELVVARVRSRSVHSIDFGNGRRQEWWNPDDFAVCPPGMASHVLAESHHRIEIVSLHRPGWAAMPRLDLGRLHARSRRHPRIHALLDRCLAAGGGLPDAAAAEWLAAALCEALDTASRERNGEAPKPAERLTPWALRRVVERLMAFEQPTPSLMELATMASLSPSHFCRAFRAETGLPPHRFQAVRRIEKARAMLRVANVPVQCVGAAVGIPDRAYFSRMFARETGMTPTAWRQSVAATAPEA